MLPLVNDFYGLLYTKIRLLSNIFNEKGEKNEKIRRFN